MMKKLIASLMFGAFVTTTAAAYACDGKHEGTTTKTTDTKKSNDATANKKDDSNKKS